MQFSENEGFAGLDLYAGEVELCAEAGEGGFDEVVLARGDSAGDEEHVGLNGFSQRGVESFGGVGGGGKDEGIATGTGDERGEHGSVGVADFAGAGGDIDGNEFVAGGEDGDARPCKDFEPGVAAGGGEGDLRGAELDTGRKEFVAAAGLRASGDDVIAGIDGSRCIQRDRAAGFFDVLEHDDAVGAFGDGRAGHDLPCGGRGQRGGRGFAGVGGSGNGEDDVCGGFGGAACVAVASGAREGWLIVVGEKRSGEDAVGSVGQVDALGEQMTPASDGVRVFRDDGGGLFVAREIGAHVSLYESSKF